MKCETTSLSGQIPAQFKRIINQTLTQAARHFHLPSKSEISVVLVSVKQMQQLNRIYLGKNRPTTTLSFSYLRFYRHKPLKSQFKHYARMMKVLPLGEIFLCLDAIQKFSQRYKYSSIQALKYIARHSFLHLLGYHHSNPKADEQMTRAINKLISLDTNVVS